MSEVMTSQTPTRPHESSQVSGARRTTARAFGGLPRIVAFFALIAAIAFGLNLVFNHGLRRVRTSKFGAFNRMMSGEVNADVIINGSSRALSHYDPRIIKQITGSS